MMSSARCQPQPRPTASAVARASPREHPDRESLLAQEADRLGRLGADRVGDGDRRRAAASVGREPRDRRAVGREAVAPGRAGRRAAHRASQPRGCRPSTARPSTVPRTPWPGDRLERLGRPSAEAAVGRARATTAAPSGCSLARSSAAARSRTSSSVDARRGDRRRRPPAGPASACRSCRTRPCRPARPPRAPRRSRTRMPASAPRPVATMIAVGVARPIAHGHAMIDHPDERGERERQPRLRPERHHTTNVTAAATRTAGTNHSLIRSARRWSGALLPWARRTSSTIRASAVSRPTRVARTTTLPVVFTVAAEHLVAGRLRHRHRLAGQHRLVDRRRALDDEPVDRHPSPGRTRSRSPGTTVGDRDVVLAVGIEPARGRRLEADEAADRAGRAALGARLEPAAQEHEAQDDRRSCRSTSRGGAPPRGSPRGTA